MVQILGWCSSLVLLVTIAAQIRKQWRERTAKGISPWLYVGQAAASTGFAVYSGLLRNWVFLFTNSALGIAAVIGLALTVSFKRTSANERRRMPSARHIVSVGFHHQRGLTEVARNGAKAAMEGNGG